MKNKLRITALFLLLLMVVSMSGCKFSVLSADKLLRPPKSGAEIEDAVEKFAGESIILKNPISSSSDFSSSLTLFDLDYDSTEEAVVFYSTVSNENSVHMNVLKHIGDEWISVGDFSGYGSNIESLSFRNLSNDINKFDIVTTWSYIDSKVLTIHKLAGEGRRTDLRLVCDEAYESMGYVDVNKDGFYEMFIINGDFSDKTKVPTAKVIRIDKYDVLNIGMVSLSRGIVGFINSFCFELIDEDIPMMAVYDYVNSDGFYGTDVVYWDSNRSCLNVMQVDKATNSAFSTLRTLPVMSGDINADALIEIPVQEQIVGSSVNEKMYNSGLTYTKWCRIIPTESGIKLEPVGNYRFYFTDKDYLDVSKSLVPKITVSKNTSNNVWYITTYNKENLEENKVLVAVKSVSLEDADKYISSGYKQLSSNSVDNRVLVYTITEDGNKMGFNESNLVNISISN